MAKEIGGFAKEGLDVEVLSISSNLAVPALIANELETVQMSAAPGSARACYLCAGGSGNPGFPVRMRIGNEKIAAGSVLRRSFLAAVECRQIIRLRESGYG